jgi:glutathione S-transferase
MDYVEVKDAIDLPGLRLVLTAGVPGPWGEAAKAILHVKGIAYTPVRQQAGEESALLQRWTGQNGAPAAMYERERPRTGWAEILLLAERLAPQPRLVPSDPGLRALMFGLSYELCGEEGLGWSRRLMIFDAFMRDKPIDPSDRLAWKYGYSPAGADAAVIRVRDITSLFAERLRGQRTRGSRFLVGDELTAADLYWAAFATMLVPLPPEQCPIPEFMRPLYELSRHPSGLSCDSVLIDHRDFIVETYLRLPMDF